MSSEAKRSQTNCHKAKPSGWWGCLPAGGRIYKLRNLYLQYHFNNSVGGREMKKKDYVMQAINGWCMKCKHDKLNSLICSKGIVKGWPEVCPKFEEGKK